MFGLLVMTGQFKLSDNGSGSGSDGRRFQFEFGSKSVQLVAHIGKEVRVQLKFEVLNLRGPGPPNPKDL